MKRISFFVLAACSANLAAQAQLIDAFTGESLGSYTTVPILDNSTGGGEGVSFTDSSSGLTASYVGTGSSAEQSLFLTSTALPVGDALVVYTSIPVSGTTEDLGLAISSSSPVAASSANGWSSRTSFDFATISVRPSQTSIRQNTSIGGTLTTSADVLNGVAANTVTGLVIENLGSEQFTLGYLSGNSFISDDTVTFEGGSTVGSEIGIYGDLRSTGTSLGTLSGLTIESVSAVPEPTSLAMAGMGLAGLGMAWRRRNK
jgi:hypothetical protein